MEQIQNDLRANQGSKIAMSRRRAVEKYEQHPQLSIDNEIKETEEQMSGGSIDARMRRVVGAGRRKKAGAGACGAGLTGASNGVMVEGGAMHGGARSEGMALARHLEKLHGAGWLGDFWDGFKSVVKPVADIVSPIANVASFIPGPIGMAGKVGSVLSGLAQGLGKPEQQFLSGAIRKGRGRPRKMAGGAGTTSAPGAGIEVEHAVADSQLAPNVRPAVAYGNPPQAAASFKKNSVGMGRMKGCGMPDDVECLAGGAKKTRKPSARGAMISKLMKEHGMSLGEASKYLKEHGSA
jgi:hypothetical protein